ncbi:hypothetical protein DQW77_17950, partial [Roseovarius sp. TE539]
MFARHAVAIAVILHEAGGSDPQSFFDIAVERATQWAQLDLLILKDFGDCAMLLISMAAFSQLLAAQQKPGIQRRQIVKGQPGSEELATQKLHLVLDLTLLPSRSGGAGDRFDDIVVHQGQKAWVKDPVLRSRDIGHHGFGVVDDHPAR